MTKRADDMETRLKRLQKKNEHLIGMVEEEREKNAGYEEIIRIYTAYISILLKRIGAVKDNGITIKSEDITEALNHYEARATQTNDGEYCLWCEESEKKEEFYGVQGKASKFEGEEANKQKGIK